MMLVQRAITLEWPRRVDLPTRYVNAVLISHSGPEFRLVFGEAEVPFVLEEGIAGEIKSIPVKPIVKLAIAPEAMISIARVINENLDKYLAKRGQSLQTEVTEED